MHHPPKGTEVLSVQFIRTSSVIHEGIKGAKDPGGGAERGDVMLIFDLLIKRDLSYSLLFAGVCHPEPPAVGLSGRPDVRSSAHAVRERVV